MSLKYKTLTVGVSLVLMSVPPIVHADDSRGFAISAGVGHSTISDDDGAQSFEGDDIGWSLDLEYRFTAHVAFGLGVFSLGKASDDVDNVATTIEAGGTGLFLRGIIPVSESVEIYARLGRAIYSADIEPAGFDLDDGTEIGIGIDVALAEKWAVRLEGRQINGDDDEDGGLATVGVTYRF